MALTWLRGMCVASTLLLVACGGKVGGEGGVGDPDGGDPSDGGVDPSDGGVYPDAGGDDAGPWTDGGWVDGGDPKPDGGPGGCGWGACMPGTGCSDGCNDCKCVDDGQWICTGRYCDDAGPPPPPPPCPSYAPSDYMPCPVSGAFCNYANNCGGVISAQCVGDPSGKQYWMTKGEPCAAGCPTSRPSEGAGCNGANRCAYSNGCGGTDVYYCGGVMSYWKLEKGPCAPMCPPSEPPYGAYCSGPMKCEWKSACGGVNYGSCSPYGTWITQPGPCPQPLPCPPSLPSNGGYCPAEGVCYYMNSCGTQDKAYCPGPSSSSGWQVSKQPCGACPTTMPTQGTACSTTSRECAWNNGCGSIAYGYCDPSYGWQIKQPGCNPSCPGTKPTSGAACTVPGGSSCTYVVSPGSTCQTQCFCADDLRWACVTPPCAATPP